jgi:hypothetical protein
MLVPWLLPDAHRTGSRSWSHGRHHNMDRYFSADRALAAGSPQSSPMNGEERMW